MNSFYIISNVQKDRELKTARMICDYLREHGAQCAIHSGEKSVQKGSPVISDDAEQTQAGLSSDSSGKNEEKRSDCVGNTDDARRMYTNISCVPEGTQGILVIGGDGTLLHAARDLMELHLPLLGINLGTLGYLAEVDRKQIFPAMDVLLEDRYDLEERMMLYGEVLRKGKKIGGDIALNDIVITRAGKLRIMDFNVYVNGEFLSSYRADGMILSTPTGSTGYNLSAGGPIVAPQASLMLLTAIAPHTMNSRPIVLPDRVSVSFEISVREPDACIEATFDGDTSVRLQAGDRVVIRKASVTASFLKTRHTSFLEILREKMNH